MFFLVVSGILAGAFAEIHHVPTTRKLDFSFDSLTASSFDINEPPNALFSFTGQVMLGSNNQPLQVVYDTGSPLLWVRSGFCFSMDCAGQPKFDTSTSSTFESNRTVSAMGYGDGSSVSTYLSQDTVQVAGYSVPQFTFGAAFDMKFKMVTDGIMGLSLPPPHANYSSYFGSLMTEKVMDSNVFSYHIDHTDNNGGFTFGGVDLARFQGPLHWINGNQDMGANGFGYWNGPIDLSVQNGNVSTVLKRGVNVIWDTGTSLFMVTPSLSKLLNEQANVPLIQGSIYGVICSDGKLPNSFKSLVITVGDFDIVFEPEDYMFRIISQGQTYCFSSILGGRSEGEMPILGNSMLRKLYTVFDQESSMIGIAVANRDTIVDSVFVGDSYLAPKHAQGTASKIGGNSWSGSDIPIAPDSKTPIHPSGSLGLYPISAILFSIIVYLSIL